MRWRNGLLFVLLVCCLLPGCTGGAEKTGYVLYFVSDGQAGHGSALGWECYPYEEEPQPEVLMERLLAGPKEEGLISPFPHGVTLRECRWDEERPGVMTVNLSEQYGALTDIGLTLADYCIVLTLSQLDGVESVEILSNGNPSSYRSHQLMSPDEAILWDDLPQAKGDSS